ncbi:uncharacterized protein LOC100903080 [Galendromus occidentalis]|uniref:Uncharacterized protein LOC100903080 n=1 Tax=Galendromus occidentalis TaxID=34638 RepID=A0AAJ6QSH9_9ACAR|nr:uncharacterized protein LOC100903080 [Galendromus occidentalis]
MLGFTTVFRNQPNKCVDSSVISPRSKVREVIVDHGFVDCNLDTDFQDDDAEHTWQTDTEERGEQPYDCYVGSVSPPRKSPAAETMEEDRALPTQDGGEDSTKMDPDDSFVSHDSDCDSLTTFIKVDSLRAKFAKCVELVKKVPTIQKVIVVVNETDIVLMTALLCLSNVAAEMSGKSATLVQVVRARDLRKVRGPVDVVINVDMVSSLAELAGRGELLRNEGRMKTLFMEEFDKNKCRAIVSASFKCGLGMPFELESYIV